MSQPLSRTRWNKIKHWAHADPPFILGDHTALARVKFWTARFIRFCWRWRDISPGPLFVAVAWLWGHSPVQVWPWLHIPRFPLVALVVVGGAITVWSIHFDSSRGHTANKDRTACKAKRHWQKVAIDCKFEEVPKLLWASVKDHATILNVELVEGTNERKLYLDATRRLHTIYQKPVRFKANGDGSATVKILHRDPLKDEPALPAFLGNDDGPALEPRWDWLPYAIDDDDETFGINLHQNHMLVIGQIGSGKSTSVNTLACGAVVARYVTPWWQDPQDLSFKPFRNAGPYAGDPDNCLQLMKDFHEAMRKRELEMSELDCSLAMPTVKWPLQIMFIDELKRLIDPRLRGDEFVKTYLGLLFDVLDTGRKVGFSIVATSTDPRASLFEEGLRNQFTMSTCFKVRDVTAARVALGTIEKHYEPHLLPKVPGRCVFMGAEWHQLRTFRVWDDQVRKVVDSLQTQPVATRGSVDAMPASPQEPLTNGDVSVSADVLLPRRRRGRRDDTRARIVAHLQTRPGQLVAEIAEDLDIPESNIRYWFGPTCANPIPVRRLGYRYELVS